MGSVRYPTYSKKLTRSKTVSWYAFRGALDDGLSADELADVDVEDLIADQETEDEDEADQPSDGFGTQRR